MWACSRKVEAMVLAAAMSILSPAMLNLSRNSDRNKTSTHYEVIIQFWRFSIVNHDKSNIDKNTCEPLNLCLFLLMKLQMLFQNFIQDLAVINVNNLLHHLYMHRAYK